MSQADVFRPAEGPLLVTGNISDGCTMPTDHYRKNRSRPATQSSGYRFGSLSHNSFFSRHKPHPARVRHLKGLLDIPICSVNDEGVFASPRYSLQFPPNVFDSHKLREGETLLRMPVNSINVNSQLHPINTITGLQYFVGKPLNQRIFREKAVPQMGLVPETEGWRDELRALAHAIGYGAHQQQQPREQRPETESRPRTQYSQETGRLIPPPSRAMSRGVSRRSCRTASSQLNYQHIADEYDNENMILQILCQVLQTDDVNAVQAWLVSAGDREKALVLEMVRAAVVSSDEYNKHKAEPIEYRPSTRSSAAEPERPVTGTLPAIDNNNNNDSIEHKIDRLSLDGVQPRSPGQQSQENKFMRYSYSPVPPKTNNDDTKAPVCNDVFRPASRAVSRPASSCRSALSRPSTSEPRLRMTNRPMSAGGEGLSGFDPVLQEENDPVWNPQNSHS